MHACQLLYLTYYNDPFKPSPEVLQVNVYPIEFHRNEYIVQSMKYYPSQEDQPTLEKDC